MIGEDKKYQKRKKTQLLMVAILHFIGKITIT